jgi:hypothetical protein
MLVQACTRLVQACIGIHKFFVRILMWDCNCAGLWAMDVWAGSCSAVEDCFGFPSVDRETCFLGPCQAFSISGNQAGTYQMI